jgi:hypothetical protein
MIQRRTGFLWALGMIMYQKIQRMGLKRGISRLEFVRAFVSIDVSGDDIEWVFIE